uniref:Uncharacterized protein n=1 Tax=Panagrolaimus davidi TaxID=227884 RepID=A0A914QL94_9BILA
MCIGLPWLGIVLVIFDWLTAIIFAIFDYSDIVENTNLAIIALTAIAMSLILFSFMPSLTYKRYMYAATNIKEFSLSQRYQMSENYRSAKLLTKVVWCFGITTVLAGVLFVLSRVLKKPHSKIFQELYPLPFLIQSLIYPLLVMYYEPKVREFIICQKATNRIFIAKSITGQNLVISNTDEQREAYFHSYRQAWS